MDQPFNLILRDEILVQDPGKYLDGCLKFLGNDIISPEVNKGCNFSHVTGSCNDIQAWVHASGQADSLLGCKGIIDNDHQDPGSAHSCLFKNLGLRCIAITDVFSLFSLIPDGIGIHLDDTVGHSCSPCRPCHVPSVQSVADDDDMVFQHFRFFRPDIADPVRDNAMQGGRQSRADSC